MGRRWCWGRGRGGLGGVNPLILNLKRLNPKGRRILYAPRQPPTLVRLLRINTLLIYSLRCLASAVLMLTPWVGPCGAGDPGGTPRGARASRAHGRTDARFARARRLRRRQGQGAKGPKGQGDQRALWVKGPAHSQRTLFRMQ